MARARNIKPSFFINEELVELDFSIRLLFIGLWTIADRAGRLEDKPKRIKMALFPADDVDVDSALDRLQEKGFIVRYINNETQYIQILAFEKHQNPHVKEPASTIPAPELHGASTVQATLIPDTPLPITDSPSLNEGDSRDVTATPQKNGTRLPADWKLPKTWGDWAIEARPDLSDDEIRAESENFRDYWVGNANQAKAKKADWEATWRVWIRKANKPRSSPPRQTIAEQNEKNKQAAYQRLFGGQQEKDVTNEAG